MSSVAHIYTFFYFTSLIISYVFVAGVEVINKKSSQIKKNTPLQSLKHKNHNMIPDK